MTQPMPYAIPTMHCPNCGMPLYAGMGCATHDPMVLRCFPSCGYTISIPLEAFRFRLPAEPAALFKLVVDTCQQAADNLKRTLRGDMRLMALAAVKEHEEHEERERARQQIAGTVFDPNYGKSPEKSSLADTAAADIGAAAGQWVDEGYAHLFRKCRKCGSALTGNPATCCGRTYTFPMEQGLEPLRPIAEPEKPAEPAPCPFKPGDKVEWDAYGDGGIENGAGTVVSIMYAESWHDWCLGVRGAVAGHHLNLHSARCHHACPFAVGQWVSWSTSAPWTPYRVTTLYHREQGWVADIDDGNGRVREFVLCADLLPCPPRPEKLPEGYEYTGECRRPHKLERFVIHPAPVADEGAVIHLLNYEPGEDYPIRWIVRRVEKTAESTTPVEDCDTCRYEKIDVDKPPCCECCHGGGQGQWWEPKPVPTTTSTVSTGGVSCPDVEQDARSASPVKGYPSTPEQQAAKQVAGILRDQEAIGRAARAASIRGKYAGLKTSSDDFAAEKQAEIDREDGIPGDRHCENCGHCGTPANEHPCVMCWRVHWGEQDHWMPTVEAGAGKQVENGVGPASKSLADKAASGAGNPKSTVSGPPVQPPQTFEEWWDRRGGAWPAGGCGPAAFSAGQASMRDQVNLAAVQCAAEQERTHRECDAELASMRAKLLWQYNHDTAVMREIEQGHRAAMDAAKAQAEAMRKAIREYSTWLRGTGHLETRYPTESTNRLAALAKAAEEGVSDGQG